MFKKILFILILTPICLAALMVFTAFVILNWPTLIINDTSLEMAAKYLKPIGIELSWKEVKTSMQSHGYLDETVGLSFDDLCVVMKPEVDKICFKHVDLAGRYRFRAFIPKLMSVGPINIEDGEVALNLPTEEKKEPSGPLEIPEIKLPFWLKGAKFFPINVDIKSINVRQDKASYTGNVEVKIEPDDKQRLSRVNAKGSLRIAPAGQNFNFDVTVQSPAGFIKNIWKLEAQAKASLGGGMSASVDANIDGDEHKNLKHDLKITFNKDKINVKAEIKGSLSKKEFETKLIGSINNISDELRRVNLPNCVLKLTAKKLRMNRGELNLSCPVDLILKKFEIPPDMEKIYHPPERVRIDVSSKADTFFMPDMDEKTSGTINIRIEPTRSRLVQTRGGVKVKFAGVPSEALEKWNVESNLDIDFIIKEFSNLVKVLDTTKWPVPAPFNVLQGSLEFSLEGRVSSASKLGSFPAKFETRLKSEKQSINIDSKGELNLVFAKNSSKANKLKLDIKLNDVQLQLPDIALAAIPRFTPDGRIILGPKKEEEKKEEEVPFDYDLQVATPKGNPVRILSNLTPKYIPINVDVDAKKDGEEEDFSGTVKIEHFPIKLFSREANVEKLDFKLQEPLDMTIVDGSMSMQFPELKIIIVMMGPVKSPNIMLESDPPMTQGDIVSTLLYGEPLDNIDSDQASSVNSMNAAMSDRAMALTSFFLLGSTPIQSIAYNPETKMFAAKLRLGKKTSLTVGGGESNKYVKIGRRLGKGFRISTGVEKDDDYDDQAAATAMIEWSKRY